MTDPAGPSAAATRLAESRRPIVVDEVRAALRGPRDWSIRAVASTGSTNDDLALQARTGGHREVLIAELQRAGKGRRGRTWTAPAGAGLTMSVLLSLPEVPLIRRSWIGALAGLCLVTAVRSEAGVPAGLKWPNDLLVDDRKCAGLLAEATADGVVIGMGINVSLTVDELPRPDATSLLLAGAHSLDRPMLAAAVLDQLADWVDRWQAAAGDPDRSGLRPAYLAACSTVGERVRIELPGGEHVVGLAADVTTDGALVVDTTGGRRSFAAGDVHHLRKL